MSFRSVAAKNVVLRMVGVMTVAGAALVTVSVANESFIRAQPPQSARRPNLRLPDEAAGIDGIVRTLISAFDQVDIVALGEAHMRRLDSHLRIALVRHPDFAKKVRSIVVEFGSTTEQSTLDRYIRGENVSSGGVGAGLEHHHPSRQRTSGTHRFTRISSQRSATSIRGCLPMREFASSAATPDQETTVAVRLPPSQF